MTNSFNGNQDFAGGQHEPQQPGYQPQQAYPQTGHEVAGFGYPGGYQQPGYAAVPQAQQRSYVAALLLCFFLGSMGAHNFYTGRTGRAVVQLILFICGWATVWFFGFGLLILVPLGLWVFIEFILILASGGGYDCDARGVPLLK